MKPAEPTPVKLFCGILYSDQQRYEEALSRLIDLYGSTDFTSQVFRFDMTTYYQPEMGKEIFRLFVSFERLISPGDIARIKIECNDIEDRLAVDDLRRVNLDPGYMDYAKVVLASAKYNSHKIYLARGIYADTTLVYEKGRYHPSQWAFPDYRTPDYQEIFLKIRARYKGQLRRLQRNARNEPGRREDNLGPDS